jgi:carbamoyltransferase
MTDILGISAFYHDSAASLLVDGQIVAAAQEERFSRKKHDPGFPSQAIDYCLAQAGIGIDQVDYVAFYDKPLAKFERLIETYLAFVPDGFASFRLAVPALLSGKLDLRRTLRKALGKPTAKFVFVEHHESHAASAFFPSPYDQAAILTLDGVGEWATTTFGQGKGNRIDLSGQISFPHSLGLLYSAFTYYCGFKVNSGEYKLMGLAPYGKPVYANVILETLIDLKPDGSFRLNLEYFRFCQGLTMTGPKFDRLFGGPARRPESPLEQRHMDLAASIQAVTEEIMLRIAREIHARTGQKHLVLAGGVALNCVANGRLLREGPFDSIWIQPAAGDAGGALGAALFVWHQLLERPRVAGGRDAMQAALLGPGYSNAEIARELKTLGASGQTFSNRAERDAFIAQLIDEGNVVGLFQGRMEFGPRALGARSLLGDPRSPKMQATMNLKIKFRESFRPFAPCVLREHASEWFGLRPEDESPYMLLVAPVLESHRIPLDTAAAEVMASDPDLMRRVNIPRSTIPAVTHVDYSARVQTIDRESNSALYGILSAFYARTGCPVLINTSFNVRGEPIVCSPAEAYRCFLATGIDALVLEDTVLVKDASQREAEERLREKHLAQYALD